MEKPSSTQSDASSNTQSTSPTKRFKSSYSQDTLHSFMNEKTREEIVVRSVAADGLLPSVVWKSEFICQAFYDKGMLFPKKTNHLMQLVYKQYEIAYNVAMIEMQQFVKSGKRFRLSLDEYSSYRHKRYLNINVHQDKFINLGMVAISGRIDAKKLFKK